MQDGRLFHLLDNLSILVIQATMERASSDFGRCLKPPGLEIWGGTRLRASMASPPVSSILPKRKQYRRHATEDDRVRTGEDRGKNNYSVAGCEGIAML